MSNESRSEDANLQKNAVATVHIDEPHGGAGSGSGATVAPPRLGHKAARFRTQWMHGDWDSLSEVKVESLSDGAEDGLIALYAAAGHLQRGSVADARALVRLALQNGVAGQDVLRVLVSGTYASLAKAARAAGTSIQRAEDLLKTALAVGAPDDDLPLLLSSREAHDMVSSSAVGGADEPDTAPTLLEIYSQHEGFVSDKWDRYLYEYDRLFSPIRNEPVSLLEIGVQNGGSLEIWDRYFPNAEAIVGCDIDLRSGELENEASRVSLVIGDVKAEETRDAIISKSNSFDIIIDDGSHVGTDIIAAFCQLFPFLAQGGIYIAEDLHCSYWEKYCGGLDDVRSSMHFFKALVDVINHEHWGLGITRAEYLKDAGYPCELPEQLLWDVHAVEFLNSLCCVRRALINRNELGRRRVKGRIERLSRRSMDGLRSETPNEQNLR